MANLMVRLLLQNKSQYVSLARNARILSTSTCLRSNVPSPDLASGPTSSAPTATTGWDRARYPQEELLEMHRKAAKTEDPRLERRRRLFMVKLIIAIGASFVLVIGTFLAVALYARHDHSFTSFF